MKTFNNFNNYKFPQLNGSNVNYKEMMETARDKLIVWGLTESQVTSLETNNASSLIAFYSKVSGVVDEVLTSEVVT